MATHPREEIEATVARYVKVRAQIDAKEATWDALLPFFTDDVVFNDPAWGRVEGIDAFRTFLEDSMAGLDDWTFPVEFTAVEGDNVIVKWTEVIPGTRPDGRPAVQSGWSRLVYAGGGKFRYEEDVLNMAHVLEDLAVSGWQPTGPMNMPPEKPDRDFSVPAA
ncbi:MAG: ketosteroid isomerase-like enzyme [Acidimicrobiales bacterium]|jgi:ketosteroid isomerase-like protein|nr:ketosteroid isomerase-like enzyme [Acidimicrobiales bacterium]